ncbi:MAG: sulfotransferase-like domain-containing protein [Shimia sp.]
MRRIAVWSGPRNLSTALMYAFGNRADVQAMDEPFYAAYLAETGLDHPLRAAVLAAQPTDPGEVVRRLRVPRARIHYEKHMTHHMRPGFPLGWMDEATNVFLIRHPARVIASYERKRAAPTLEDLGFPQQAALMARVADPVVIDADDILRAPREMLQTLCARIGIPFDEAMLSWPAGPKPFDGVWAPHWYDGVHRSTGFGEAPGEVPEVGAGHAAMIEPAVAEYERLRARRLTPSDGRAPG